jgi:membrane-associated phospholipid phosphatase
MGESMLKLMGIHPVLCFILFLALTFFCIAFVWRLIDKGLSALPQRFPSFKPRQRISHTRHGLNKKILGAYIVFVALLGLGALSVFWWIAGEVVNQEAIVRFDYHLGETIRRNATLWETGIFRLVTIFGSFYVLAPISLGVAVVLLVLHRRIFLFGWMVAVLGGVIVNVLLKSIFERPRPEPVPPLIDDLTSWSFPSGHAMDSLIIYGMFTYLLIRLIKGKWSKTLILLSVGLVLSIGFSRLYLGVHYFSDIIAGYAAGIFWLNLSVVTTEILRHTTASKAHELPPSQQQNDGS